MLAHVPLITRRKNWKTGCRVELMHLELALHRSYACRDSKLNVSLRECDIKGNQIFSTTLTSHLVKENTSVSRVTGLFIPTVET